MNAPNPSNTNLRQSLAHLFSIHRITWNTARDYGLIFLGSFIQALALRLFLIPAQLVSGGVSGTAQLINHYTGWAIGLMVFIGNLPLFFLGWRYLGGARFAARTAFAIVTFSLLTDLSVLFMPSAGLTDDFVLNSLYGGVMLGAGLGLVYRGQGTSGGSDILGRILNHRLGIPISQSYLVSDALVILAAGFVFGWENALYALVMTYVSGIAAELVLEGTGVFRTAMIITTQSAALSHEIMTQMARGVTILPGIGAYTGAERSVLYCVITRSEVTTLKSLVKQIDPRAFMVIGQAHEAIGEGFRALK
ncbi:MAG TPA: YitT family protein [Anaerolineaceae bacterium]